MIRIFRFVPIQLFLSINYTNQLKIVIERTVVDLSKNNETKKAKMTTGSGILRNIHRESILYLLKRYEKLSANEIQEKLGLKRQTSYNYLNKLLEEKKLQIEYLPHPENPRINVAYYSLIMTKKEIGPDFGNQIFFVNELAKKSIEGKELKEGLLNKINLSIAALIEQRIIIDQLPDEEIIDYLETLYKNNNYPGPFTSLIFLTNDEYREIGEEMQKLLNRLWNKWREESPGLSDGNIFMCGFYKAPDFIEDG